MKRQRPVYTVYFAIPLYEHRVKIGCTAGNLQTRMGRLTARLGRRIDVMFAFATFDRRAERVIHWMLREQRIVGEWFDVMPSEIETVIRRWIGNSRYWIVKYEKARESGYRHKQLKKSEFVLIDSVPMRLP